MSFFSNAVRLISGKKKENSSEVWSNPDVLEQNVKFDFSFRNYVKESFSVLIIRPLSGCVMKVVRVTSVLVTGIVSGVVVASLCCLIFMQFESVENTVLSSILHGRFEKLLPDSDFSIKSATLQWNPKVGAIEIVMNKVRLDDFLIPRVSILPDYRKSFKQQKLVAKSVSILNPRISISVENDFKDISLNPNFEKSGNNKVLFEPFSELSNLCCLLDNGATVKLINADVSIAENGADWKFNNVYCEYKMGENFPKIVDCSASFPGQRYVSNIGMIRSNFGNKSTYNIKIESVNPSALNAAFAKRSVPIDSRVFSLIDGYNLPVSGTLKLDFKGTKFLGGKFDLIGASGSIKLPTKSTISLNIGKRIDNGSISGTFLENGVTIDSINVSYGNSGLQLTGIKIPLSEFKFLDVANIDGTLSLTNIDVREMESILPENISRTAVTTFKNYLPNFRLELFKIDLKGAVAFGNKSSNKSFEIGNGVFRIKDAKIPLGEHVVTNVSATGTISDDGFDIRLNNAIFGKSKINSGVFFVSNKDNSWIGKINANVPIDDVASYGHYLSKKLASLPLEKLHLKGKANLDMKLVRVEGDKLLQKDLPFRIVGGEGTFKSDDNSTRELRLSWDDKKLFINGDAVTGQNKVNLKIGENFEDNSGNGEFLFSSSSDFLAALAPDVTGMCNGDYVLKVNSSWNGEREEYDVDLDLKNATMNIPMIGDVKLKKEDGRFAAHILNDGKKIEFSKMVLNTPNCKFGGKMTLGKDKVLQKCSLDNFENNGSFVKLNILRNNDRFLFSAIGNCLDLSRALSISDKVEKDVTVSAYLNLEEVALSNTQKIRNVKGNLELKNGKIIGGACYGVIGENTTLALTAKDIEGTDDTMLAVSASDAGEFLKYFKIIDTVNGGSVKFVMKSSKNIGKSFSGIFEMNDFIVKNNAHLMKLISLSSTNLLSGIDNLSVGFNFCSGNITISNNIITIENGKAISPAVAISYNGSYDRLNDNFDINGVSLPMSSILSSANTNGALVADYRITGSLGMPSLSVKPLRFVDSGSLNETFGNVLPILIAPSSADAGIVQMENSTDPFSQGAFDKKAGNTSEKKIVEEKATVKEKAQRRRRVTDNKFGIKIVRGVKDA
ncbi:MAG: hypothetical protein LBB21_01415 [Holosporaceae bacterium]|jgi:hypothetical protein|nr:hypothetical protein [Holosporaceae bacterium]